MEVIAELPLSQITVVDFNPRKYFDHRHISELAESIARAQVNGLMEGR